MGLGGVSRSGVRRLLILVPLVLAVVTGACSSRIVVPTEQLLQAVFGAPNGEEMRYLVWLPEGYGDDAERRYPLIVFLHGSGDEDYDSTFVASYGLPAVLAQHEEPPGFEFVVIAPQAAPGSVWYTTNQPEIVDGVVQEAIDTYLVDTDRVYLTGLSMGGYGSWHIAARYPERYAAMVSISGSGFQSEALPPADYACRLAGVPVWGIHGERDLIALYEPIAAHVAAWEALCDAEVAWTSLPEDGHFSTYERAYRDPALYDWMLEHTAG